MDEDIEIVGTALTGNGKAIRSFKRMQAYIETTRKWLARCRQCGGEVTQDRFCFAIPTCHTCLPPPPPLDTIELP